MIGYMASCYAGATIRRRTRTRFSWSDDHCELIWPRLRIFSLRAARVSCDRRCALVGRVCEERASMVLSQASMLGDLLAYLKGLRVTPVRYLLWTAPHASRRLQTAFFGYSPSTSSRRSAVVHVVIPCASHETSSRKQHTIDGDVLVGRASSSWPLA